MTRRALILCISLAIILLHVALFCFLTKGKTTEVQTPEHRLQQQEMPRKKSEEKALSQMADRSSIQNPVQGFPSSRKVQETNVPQPPEIPQTSSPVMEKLAPLPNRSVAFQIALNQKPMPAKLKQLLSCCKAGIAVDLDKNQVLWSKNPSMSSPIASLTKMMTVFLAMENLRASQGKITLETPIRVTREAARIGGREVWLDPRETFTFEELLKCALVHSANDAAYLLAQFTAGSADAFVERMNQRAREMGWNSMLFVNTNGLPEKQNPVGRQNDMSSPEDLAKLASLLAQDPVVMRWCKVRRSTLRENDQEFLKRNKNQATMLSSSNGLLGSCEGVNGMKTGYTEKAGFCIVITCERQGTRTCVVLLGCDTRKNRDAIGRAMLNWIYSK